MVPALIGIIILTVNFHAGYVKWMFDGFMLISNAATEIGVLFEERPDTGKSGSLFVKGNRTIDMSEKTNFYVKYGGNEKTASDVIGIIDWKACSGNIEADRTYVPARPGRDKITLRVKKGTRLASGVETAGDVEMSFDVAVNGLYLEPAAREMKINETLEFTVKYGVDENESAAVRQGVEWSVISDSHGDAGHIADGLYTAPRTPGKYTVMASYRNMSVTGELTVKGFSQDENIKLSVEGDYKSFKLFGPFINAEKKTVASGQCVPFRINVNAPVSTVEAAITSGRGRLAFNGKTMWHNAYYMPSRLAAYNFIYYAPEPDLPYEDTNEIVRIAARCPENVKTSAEIEVLVYKPVLGDTTETFYPSGRRKAFYKTIGYRDENGTWIEIPYKSVFPPYGFFHGSYFSWYDDENNTLEHEWNYYCGEFDGVCRNYFSGRKQEQYVFKDFHQAIYTEWTPDQEIRIVNNARVKVPVTKIYSCRYTRPGLVEWELDQSSRRQTVVNGAMKVWPFR